jgi:hypothetical protein
MRDHGGERIEQARPQLMRVRKMNEPVAISVQCSPPCRQPTRARIRREQPTPQTSRPGIQPATSHLCRCHCRQRRLQLVARGVGGEGGAAACQLLNSGGICSRRAVAGVS